MEATQERKNQDLEGLNQNPSSDPQKNDSERSIGAPVLNHTRFPSDCHAQAPRTLIACTLTCRAAALAIDGWTRAKHPAPQSFLAWSAVLQGPVRKLCGDESAT